MNMLITLLVVITMYVYICNTMLYTFNAYDFICQFYKI